MQAVGGQILDDDVLKFAKLLVNLAVMSRKGFDVIIGGNDALFKALNIREHRFLLILHVVYHRV